LPPLAADGGAGHRGGAPVRRWPLLFILAGVLWSPPTAAAATATLAVGGPITVQLETASADVRVKGDAARQVSVTLKDGDIRQVALELHGDRVEVIFDGQHRLASGRLQLVVPHGSRVELSTVSGDARFEGL